MLDDEMLDDDTIFLIRAKAAKAWSSALCANETDISGAATAAAD